MKTIPKLLITIGAFMIIGSIGSLEINHIGITEMIKLSFVGFLMIAFGDSKLKTLE